MKILMTLPRRNSSGGVVGFFNSVLPYLLNDDLELNCVEIGTNHLEKGVRKIMVKYIHLLRDQIRVYHHILKIKPQLVHVNPSLDIKSFLRDGIFAYWAKRKNVAVLVFFHGWHHEEQIEKSWMWFFKLTFMKADAFVVLSSSFKNKLEVWGVKRPIYLGKTAVDDELLEYFLLDRKIDQLRKERTIKILFLARVERSKGILETLDAFRILVEEHHSISLTIAGDGPAKKDVRKYLEKHELSDDLVILTGYVEGKRKRDILVSHHIYCLPSRSEGMPVSLLEAMAFGMPVITRAVGGIQDFFEHEKMGYLIQDGAPDSLAGFLRHLITQKEKMVEIAVYNNRFAKNNFMASCVASELKSVYEATSSS
jgi:glycosyltransferase involved in cell wall biosynthesis